MGVESDSTAGAVINPSLGRSPPSPLVAAAAARRAWKSSNDSGGGSTPNSLRNPAMTKSYCDCVNGVLVESPVRGRICSRITNSRRSITSCVVMSCTKFEAHTNTRTAVIAQHNWPHACTASALRWVEADSSSEYDSPPLPSPSLSSPGPRRIMNVTHFLKTTPCRRRIQKASASTPVRLFGDGTKFKAGPFLVVFCSALVEGCLQPAWYG